MNLIDILDIGLAIVDIGLPDRRGDVLTGELRALHPQLPIVIATGYETPELAARVAVDPRMALMRKPYTQDDLQSVTRRLRPL